MRRIVNQSFVIFCLLTSCMLLFSWCLECHVMQDKLMTHPTETWFTSLVSLEIVFQLPFFFYAVYSILNCAYGFYFRPLCIAYGASTATTLIPILACVLSDDDTTTSEKGVLLGFYLPYLMFPLWLMILGVCEAGTLIDEGSVGMKKKK